MNGTDIAGYLYEDEPFCKLCIRELFVPLELPGGPNLSTEDILDLAAAEKGIRRYDKASFSSHTLPKPIYVADVSGADCCISCGEPLRRPDRTSE